MVVVKNIFFECEFDKLVFGGNLGMFYRFTGDVLYLCGDNLLDCDVLLLVERMDALSLARLNRHFAEIAEFA